MQNVPITIDPVLTPRQLRAKIKDYDAAISCHQDIEAELTRYRTAYQVVLDAKPVRVRAEKGEPQTIGDQVGASAQTGGA
jgi:hypothetical protein